MSSQTNSSDDGARKPGYDARQEYYKVLMKQLVDAHWWAEVGNLRLWYLELHGVFNMVSGWINKKDRERLLNGDQEEPKRLKYGLLGVRKQVYSMNGLTTRDQWASAYRNKKSIELESELLMIEEDLLVAAKYMMLPVGVDDVSGEFDIDRFRMESG